MIHLPVSIGEAIDKVTILDIKMDKISDARRQDVEKEYNTIYLELKSLIDKIPFYYQLLKNINLEIWNMQDEIRDQIISENYAHKANQIIKENDRRFRIKHKINLLCNSVLKEQKGYNIKKAYITIDSSVIIFSVGLVRYLSTVYENIVINCQDKLQIAQIYKDDQTIIISDEDGVGDHFLCFDEKCFENNNIPIEFKTKYFYLSN